MVLATTCGKRGLLELDLSACPGLRPRVLSGTPPAARGNPAPRTPSLLTLTVRFNCAPNCKTKRHRHSHHSNSRRNSSRADANNHSNNPARRRRNRARRLVRIRRPACPRLQGRLSALAARSSAASRHSRAARINWISPRVAGTDRPEPSDGRIPPRYGQHA